MTQAAARIALAATWRFNQKGASVALRDVALIEAVRAYEQASALVAVPAPPDCAEAGERPWTWHRAA